jgi:N-acetylglucosamine kinase-like BadF-type ATPase
MLVLGIDAGATKTVCLLSDESGRVVGEGRASGANPQTVGQRRMTTVLHGVIEQAIDGRSDRLDAICLGIAGADRTHGAEVVQATVERLVPGVPVLVVNDALIALEAGAPGQAGIVVVSGTGSIAYGHDGHGRAARSGGWGHMIGDEGSGYWIGKEALVAVVRHVDGRGPHTQLTPDILAHFRVASAAALLQIVYDRDVPRREVAVLGPVVQRARDAGDAVAKQILDRAVDELVLCTAAVALRLDLGAEPFAIVLAGGAFRVVPWLTTAFMERLAARWPPARVRLLDREPALGAVSLALATARGDARIPGYV